MRTKDEILKDMGMSEKYNPHGGIPTDTKEFILTEVLIDIRDILSLELEMIHTSVFEFLRKM